MTDGRCRFGPRAKREMVAQPGLAEVAEVGHAHAVSV